MTPEMEAWLQQTVLQSTPEHFGYDTTLWTCDMLAQLLSERFGVRVMGATVNCHLHRLNLTYQKPNYLPREQDLATVERFIKEKFSTLQRFANKMGADIGFADEAGVDMRDRAGKT